MNELYGLQKKQAFLISCTRKKQQKGTSFAQRFVNAISEIFAKGYENVITIGNDSPQLNSSHIIASLKQLEKNNFVLGPSADGGFYLMGLHRSLFNRDAFLELPWQNSALSRSLKDLISASSKSVVTLSTLHDIDSTDDLKTLSNFIKELPLLLGKLIRHILSNSGQFWQEKSTFFKKIYQHTSPNKGSPIYSISLFG